MKIISDKEIDVTVCAQGKTVEDVKLYEKKFIKSSLSLHG